MEEVESELREKFGLNSYEARGYLALVAAPMKPKDLAAAASIPAPRVYDTLRALETKGFVHRRGEAYVAESPGVALKTYLLGHQRSFERSRESKEASMKRIVELLQPVVATRDDLAEEPVLLRGIDAIAGRFFEILGSSSDVTLMVRKALRVKGVFSEYLEAFPLAGKRIRLLLPSRPPISERDSRLLARLGIETRFYDHPVLDMMVADGRDVVLGVPERTNDEPFSAVALWVRNPSFARSTRAAVDEIWDECPGGGGG
ncbi:MAG: TrmB family transcriptional regulator [Nitrososphaerota archaeon]|nr:TrmB family transcriptional regulator [Nitrososphaerota archaeon]MDG6967393.1 TrmB family transcriptional regulator [Nitrososphaerota archaeon]MDG6977824.1 TrmB family transcriptional regulator [Nitrososphaerota archaeon]MDG7020681.1 TrmB family transcriptional regulator [Nitrososphaerota archaeon]